MQAVVIKMSSRSEMIAFAPACRSRLRAFDQLEKTNLAESGWTALGSEFIEIALGHLI